jgi:hypothetical protein
MMNQMQWPMRLADYAYAQSLLIGWQIADHSKDTNWVYFEAALERYLQSQDHKQPLTARYHALLDSRDQFKNLFALGDGHISTYMIFIRILFDLGHTEAAIVQIETLLQKMTWLLEPLHEDLRIQINRPFLPLTHDFDQRPIQVDLGTWVQAAVIEALEIKRAPSSYFQNDLFLLKKVVMNPNHGAEMKRRERLLHLRLGLPTPAMAPAAIISRRKQLLDPNRAVWECLEQHAQLLG